jgi:Putative restriction endonuclease
MNTPSPKLAHALYAQLKALPEGLTGEIVGGQLHTHPRSMGPHGEAASVLGMRIGPPFRFGEGGPGGWWIIGKPEIHFVLETEIAVPDIAGWRQTRMPKIPESHVFDVTPDWICEIFSPSTKSYDQEVKMPLYARYGVSHVWLVDPKDHTLEAFALENEEWGAIGAFKDNDAVCVAPFDAITIQLADLWT